MKKFGLFRFLLEIKIALQNPYNKRDMALGLWVNGRANKKIRRMKR